MQPVLVTHRIPPDHLAPLDGIATLHMPDDPVGLMPRADVLAAISDAVAVINIGELRIDDELLDAAPKLRIVGNIAIGIDNLDREALARRGVWATNAPDAFTESTADTALGLILSAARHIALGDRYVRSGDWERDGFQPRRWEGMLLDGKTLGLVGYGQIGKAIARRAEAFGLRVLFTRATPEPENPAWRELIPLLGEADIVCVQTPHTPATHHLLDAVAFAAMRPGALFVNVGRGRVVDEAALVDALKCGRLGAAGLDVFETEPAVHPALRDLPNVTLTPHLGGSAFEARKAARLLAAENVARVLRGERPLTPVVTPSGLPEA